MNGKANYTVVGIFVVALSAAFVAGVLWLSVATPYQKVDRYLVYTRHSVSGLSENALVKYLGVDVGRVAEIDIDPKDPQRVRLLLEIKPDTPVKEDTTAKLEMQGLTGIAYLNLVGGTPSSRPLEATPGEPYPVIKSEPSIFTQLEDSAGEILNEMLEAIERLNDVLNAQNRDAVSRTLANAQTLSQGMVGVLGELEAVLANARQASGAVSTLVDQVKNSAAAIEKMAVELTATGTTLQRAAKASGEDVRRFTNNALPEAQALVVELRETAENLRRASEQIERNPSVLLYGEGVRRQPGPGE